ncbi:MAG: hypothetical protein AAFY26_01975 [Cyanobacteria bacterium J06638_22]
MNKPRGTKKTVRLTLDLETDFYEEIAVAALLERTPKSKLIRKAIILYLK